MGAHMAKTGKTGPFTRGKKVDFDGFGRKWPKNGHFPSKTPKMALFHAKWDPKKGSKRPFLAKRAISGQKTAD